MTTSSIDALLASSKLRRDPPPAPVGGLPALYLHAGQLHATARPTQITTVVGSCVAIALFDLEARVGGMNHFMLPFEIAGEGRSPRYAAFATEELVARIETCGADRRRLRANVFGGGTMLAGLSMSNDLGGRNVEAAFRTLDELGIPIVRHEVRGGHGRRVVFETASGTVAVRRIS